MTPPAQRRIPLVVKLVYTAFVGVLVPFYWINYGPQNFLWFCDVALLLTVPALWLESPLLASIPAVGIILPQIGWIVDFLVHLVSGINLLGIADYMFDHNIPLFVRGLSSFHGWLPFLLVWLMGRLGYDRRALVIQTVFACLLLTASYVLTGRPRAAPQLVGASAISLSGQPGAAFLSGVIVLEDNLSYLGHPNQARNVNSVFGFGRSEQTMMPPRLFFALQLLCYPVCIYLPTHLLLCWLAPGARRTAAAPVAEISSPEMPRENPCPQS